MGCIEINLINNKTAYRVELCATKSTKHEQEVFTYCFSEGSVSAQIATKLSRHI
jgi:hypothetical protein